MRVAPEPETAPTDDAPMTSAPGPGPGARAALDAALARVGDRWSLLVVHALLHGPRRFNDLLGELPGLAPNVLSHRLKHLEHERLLVATRYSHRPPRRQYELTEAGADLAHALRLLARWGAGYPGPRSADIAATHAACGTPLETRWFCPTCARTVDDDEGDALIFV